MSEATDRSLPSARKSRWLPWLALSAILVGYIFLVLRLHPENFFGYSQDDTIYFSSAKSIAEGRGYILPSVPGTPPATKYPILYPWLLSWVWRFNPSFPANLSLGLALNLFFGVAYMLATFVFLRSQPKFNDAIALTLTAVCALNPRVLFFSANLMSDIPLAALALSACVLCAWAIRKESKPAVTILCGAVTGLSILIRPMGIPIAAGLFVAIAIRGERRKAATYAACVLPFVAVLFWRSMLLTPELPPGAAPSCSQSWSMTWLYYTSYAGFWKADVLAHGVFWQTVVSNLRSLLVQPAMYFVKLSLIQPAVLALVLLLALSAVALRGVFRMVQLTVWQPIHFALGFSIFPILVWDYSVVDRCLIPFLPILCAAIWIEIRQIGTLVQQPSKRNSKMERNLAAGFLCVLGTALLFGITVSWRGEIRALVKLGDTRAALLNEKRAAYIWLRQNTSPNSRILAYEDASAFLYSGRQGLRPLTFSAAGVYRPEILNSELECMISSAKPIGASYWLVSDDDFTSEWKPASARGREKEREIEQSLHPLFHSEHGGTRIYKLNSEGEPAP